MQVIQVAKIVKEKYPTYDILVAHILKSTNIACTHCGSKDCFIVNKEDKNTVRCMECDHNFNFLEKTKYHKKNISLVNMFILDVVYNFCNINNTTFSLEEVSRALKLNYATVYKATNILIKNISDTMEHSEIHAHLGKVGLLTNELNNIKVRWSAGIKNEPKV